MDTESRIDRLDVLVGDIRVVQAQHSASFENLDTKLEHLSERLDDRFESVCNKLDDLNGLGTRMASLETVEAGRAGRHRWAVAAFTTLTISLITLGAKVAFGH